MKEDRFDKLGFGVASQLVEAGKRQLLTSVDAVSELLRELASECLSRRANYLEGKVSPEDAVKKDSAAARTLANLMNGKGPRSSEYFVQPWNSPEQMGRYLVDAYALDCPPEDAAYCVVMSFIGELYGTLDHLITLEAVEEQADQFSSIIETYTAALLGLPYEEDD